jgi:hypothetical protein
MANYAWATLLALYDKYQLTGKLKLRSLKYDILLGGEIATSLKLLRSIIELSEIVKEILRRMHAELVEEMEITQGSIRGKIVTSLVAKYKPKGIPIRRERIEFENPANLLLVATLLEVEKRLMKLIQSLSYSNPTTEKLREIAVDKLQSLIVECERILSVPELRPLIPKGNLIAENTLQLEEIEKKVSYEAVTHPREYKAYQKLLTIRRYLKNDLRVLEKETKELADILLLNLSESKIYELFALAFILNYLDETFKPSEVKIPPRDEEVYGRGLIFSGANGEIKVLYNISSNYIHSKLSNAEAHVLLKARDLQDRSIGEDIVKKLGGLPDIVIIHSFNGQDKILIFECKYTRKVNYLVQARFKAISYLYEFDANAVTIISPSPHSNYLSSTSIPTSRRGISENAGRNSQTEGDDEETEEQGGFYVGIAEYGGVSIKIMDEMEDKRKDNNDNINDKGKISKNSHGKIFAILYLDPTEEGIDRSKKALDNLFREIHPEIFAKKSI